MTVRDRDKLVCALMADSVRTRLQNFITAYRTKKVREDAAYYRDLLSSAEKDYYDALLAYSDYFDSHSGMVRQSRITEAGRLKNEMERTRLKKSGKR